MSEPTYRIAQRLHARRAAKGLEIYGRHLDANSKGCMLVHALEEAADQVNYLLAEIQRRNEVIETLERLAHEMWESRQVTWARQVQYVADSLGGKSAFSQYDEILGGGTVAENATVDPRDEALRVATEALNEVACWVPDGTRRSPLERGAKVETVHDLMQMIIAAIRAAGGAR